jgi:hypothetical protein
MKVGIITFHSALNFGAVLQTYMLAKHVERLGYKVYIINYLPWRAEMYYGNGYFKFLPNFYNLRLNYNYKSRLINYCKFKKFQSFLRNLRVTRPLYTHKSLMRHVDKSCYTHLISGSDEIWNNNNKDFRKFDDAYFLNITSRSKVKKISYGASIGNPQGLSCQHLSRIKALLGNYEHLSVRDDFTLNSLKKLGYDPELVVDPTLMSDYCKLTIEQSNIAIKKPFLVVYASKLSSAEADKIADFANEKNLAIVSLENNKHFKKFYLSAGPEEFTAIFKAAEYVYTSRYHGVLFAVKYNKKFKVVKSGHSLQKIKDFITRYKINVNAVNGFYSMDKTSNSLLEAARKSSRDFINKTLDT